MFVGYLSAGVKRCLTALTGRSKAEVANQGSDVGAIMWGLAAALAARAL